MNVLIIDNTDDERELFDGDLETVPIVGDFLTLLDPTKDVDSPTWDPLWIIVSRTLLVGDEGAAGYVLVAHPTRVAPGGEVPGDEVPE